MKSNRLPRKKAPSQTPSPPSKCNNHLSNQNHPKDPNPRNPRNLPPGKTELTSPQPASETTPPSATDGADPEVNSDPTPKPAPPENIQPSGFLRPLSKVEKIGIIALLAILAVAAVFSIIQFRKNIPVEPLIAEKLELPVEGDLITITEAETYWREPVESGENPDVVRRGVKLIPAVRINATSVSGAVRVLFRNDEGSVVGDNITRRISGGERMEIAATDGFNDVGMHAAYRAGETESWTVEVLEGPSTNAPIKKFQLLFKTEVSADMR